MSHEPPVPPGNQSPYPRHEPPHPKVPEIPRTHIETERSVPTGLIVGALVGVGAAALAWGAFFMQRSEKGSGKGSAKGSGSGGGKSSGKGKSKDAGKQSAA